MACFANGEQKNEVSFAKKGCFANGRFINGIRFAKTRRFANRISFSVYILEREVVVNRCAHVVS